MSETDRIKALELLSEIESRKKREAAQKDFLEFVKVMWPEFIHGSHHAKMAKAFERVARGELKRLIINMPPRHTKSEFASNMLPAWFLGLYPHKQVMQISHTADMAEGFGRKVRNLVDSDIYNSVFPDTRLRRDSTAAARWNTDKNGVYIAMGVGGAVAGKGADLLIIDDPISEQEGKGLDSGPFDAVYDYYMTGPRQRLQPGGAIIVVMCMTGDTPVLMSDGNEKPLQDIRPGDDVATFDKGKLATSKVINHQSSGVDSIYQIQTQSGRILRANERHPFLIMNYGVLEWTRLKHLQVGDELVVMKDAIDHQGLKQNPDCVDPACQESRTTSETLTPHSKKSGSTVNGKIVNVLKKDAQTPQKQRDYAAPTTIRSDGKKVTEEVTQKKEKQQELKAVMDSLSRVITGYLNCKEENAQYVINRPELMSEPTGEESYVSTTAMTQEKYEAYCAMTAILQLDMVKRQIYSSELQRTSDFTTDPIVSITFAGKEEVFDVEIERTENFIANGAVSHNTRWNKRDLTGRLVDTMLRNPDGDQWEVIEFPAILPSGQPLWPEFWKLEELEKTKISLDNRFWQAQYQQNPTSEEGAIVKREWWQVWDRDGPPNNIEFTLLSWDTAFEKHNRADYSALTVWGVFYLEDAEGVMRPNIILLDAVKKRVEFPELKEWAYEAYQEWEPDSVIIEKRASGASLIQELRRMGVPVQEYMPTKGNDKISRLNSVADIFASGFVWAPETRWADELIDDVASFPAGTHDDLVDTVSQAMLRFRQGGFIGTKLDEPEEDRQYYRRKAAYY
jgi:predicted phage terminase large subunit-like protein